MIFNNTVTISCSGRREVVNERFLFPPPHQRLHRCQKAATAAEDAYTYAAVHSLILPPRRFPAILDTCGASERALIG